MSEHPFRKLTTLLRKLEQAHIHYTLASYRQDAIIVLITVPGERREIEFLRDRFVEVEHFLSNGEIYDEEALDELLHKYADPTHAEAN
jgi:hypothetical protein